MKNPWKGIASYGEIDANCFKGRDKEIEKFVSIINDATMSVLYANSGIGKSSFINAGVLPSLKEGYLGRVFKISILFDDIFFKNDVDTVERWLLKKIQNIENESLKWKYVLKGEDYLCGDSIWWYLHTHELVDSAGESFLPIILFDQFEEVFEKSNDELLFRLFKIIDELSGKSLPPKVEKELSKDSSDIYASVNYDHRYKIVFSLRKEYLADFDYWTNERFSTPELLQNRMLLLPFGKEQAEEVITMQPYWDEKKGGYLKWNYVQTLDDIKDDIIEKIVSNTNPGTEVKNEVEPILLSVLCNRLFDKSIEIEKVKNKEGKGDCRLSKEDLQGIDLDSLLSIFYEEQLNKYLPKDRSQRIIEDLLVNEKGIRLRPSINELIKKGISINEIEALITCHLVRTEKPIRKRCQNKDEIVSSDEKKFEHIWIEIIHDRIADVIKDRKQKRLFSKCWAWFWLFMMFLVFVFITARFFKSDNRNHVYSELTELTDLTLMSSDATYFNNDLTGGDKNNNDRAGGRGYLQKDDLIESLVIDDTTGFSVFCCADLRTIKVDVPQIDKFKLLIKGCPNLNEVTFSDNIKHVELAVEGSPLLQIVIGPYLEELKVGNGNMNKKLGDCFSDNNFSIKIINNPRFIWELAYNNDYSKDVKSLKRNVLWNVSNIDNPQVVYAQKDVPNEFYFPSLFSKLKLESQVACVYNFDSPEFEKTIEYLNLYREREIDQLSCDTIKGYKVESYDKNWIAKVVLADSIKSIGWNAFRKCKNLKSIILSDSLETIGGRAFYGCNKLEEIVIPENVREIGDEAFSNCSSLKKVVLKTNKKVIIYRRAFSNCKNLTEVFLPDSIDGNIVYSYASNPFLNCNNLNSFIINDKEKSCLTNDNGVIIFKDKKTPLFFNANLSSYSGVAGTMENGLFYVDDDGSKRLVFVAKEGFGKTLLSSNIANQIQYNGSWLLDNYHGIILNKDNSMKDLIIPVEMFRTEWSFLAVPSNLQSIHVPYPQPVSSKGYKLEFDIPDTVKQRITLYVPYGCKKYYGNNESFSAFNNIKEENVFIHISNVIEGTFYRLFFHYRFSFFFLSVFIVILISGYLIRKFIFGNEKDTKLIIKNNLLIFILLPILVYVAIFLLTSYYGEQLKFRIYRNYFLLTDMIIAFLISIISTLLISFGYLAPQKIKSYYVFIKDKLRNSALMLFFYTEFRPYVIYGNISFAVILILCGFAKGWRDNHNPEFLIANGKNQKAISVLYKEYENKDSLTNEQIMRVDHILKRALSLPGMSDSMIINNISSVNVTKNGRYLHLYNNQGTVVYDTEQYKRYEFRDSIFFILSPQGKYAIQRSGNQTYIYQADNLKKSLCIIDESFSNDNPNYLCNERYIVFDNRYIFDLQQCGKLIYELNSSKSGIVYYGDSIICNQEGYVGCNGKVKLLFLPSLKLEEIPNPGGSVELCGNYLFVHKNNVSEIYDINQDLQLTAITKGWLVDYISEYELFISKDEDTGYTYFTRPIEGNFVVDSLPGCSIHYNMHKRFNDRHYFKFLTDEAKRSNAKIEVVSDENAVLKRDGFNNFIEYDIYKDRIQTHYWGGDFYFYIDLDDYTYFVTKSSGSFNFAYPGGRSSLNSDVYSLSLHNKTLVSTYNRNGACNIELLKYMSDSKKESIKLNIVAKYEHDACNVYIIGDWLYAYSSDKHLLEVYNTTNMSQRINSCPYLKDYQKKTLLKLCRIE